MVRLPGKTWQWSSDWEVLREAKKNDHDGTYDLEGWQYATSFTGSFSGTRSMSDFVRRRKWFRTCIDGMKQGNASEKKKKTQLTPEKLLSNSKILNDKRTTNSPFELALATSEIKASLGRNS